jgi:hypothetical protein
LTGRLPARRLAAIAGRPGFWQRNLEFRARAPIRFGLRGIAVSSKKHGDRSSAVMEREGGHVMVLFLTIVFGLMSVVYGVMTSRELLAADPGSARMQEISGAVAEGAQAYLKRQYTTIAYVGVAIFILLGIMFGWAVAFGFLLGALLSGAAGFIGMNVSVRANVRTAQAATQSLAGGLDIAFKAGAVTGLLVAGLALLGVAVYYAILTWFAGYAPSDRVVSAVRSFPSSRVLAAEFSRRARMSAPISSARSRRAYRRTTRAIPRRSPTMSATMWAIAQAWRLICSRPMRSRSSPPWCWLRSSSRDRRAAFTRR